MLARFVLLSTIVGMLQNRESSAQLGRFFAAFPPELQVFAFHPLGELPSAQHQDVAVHVIDTVLLPAS